MNQNQDEVIWYGGLRSFNFCNSTYSIYLILEKYIWQSVLCLFDIFLVCVEFIWCQFRSQSWNLCEEGWSWYWSHLICTLPSKTFKHQFMMFNWWICNRKEVTFYFPWLPAVQSARCCLLAHLPNANITWYPCIRAHSI